MIGYTGDNTAISLPSIGLTTATFPTWAGVLIGVATGFLLTRKKTKNYSSYLIMGGLGLIGYIVAKDMQTQP